MISKVNLFADIPAPAAEECFQTLFAGSHCCIQRIVSHGHASPPGFWYDQAWDEWVLVLQGQACLQFDKAPGEIDLGPGDALLIPAHRRHRVAWSDPAVDTLWLAVHCTPVEGD